MGGDAEKQSAIDEMVEMTDIAEKEAMLEAADLSDIDRIRYEKELAENDVMPYSHANRGVRVLN